MTVSPGNWLYCPNCGSARFYIKHGDGLLFFRISRNGSVVPRGGTSSTPPSDLDEAEIACASCAWHGRLAELV